MTNPANLRPVTEKEFRRAVRRYARALNVLHIQADHLAVNAAVLAEMHDRTAMIEGSNHRWYGRLDYAMGELCRAMDLFTAIVDDQPAPKG